MQNEQIMQILNTHLIIYVTHFYVSLGI